MPADQMEAYASNVYSDLFGNTSGEGLRADLKATVRERLLPHYARASTLAKRNQRFYMMAGSVAYSFAALAVAAVATGALLFKGAPIFFVLELLILATSFTVVLTANHRRTHGRWLEHRFLAERLRAACFVAACGLETSSIGVLPQHGTKRRPGGWMEMVFAEVWDRLPTMTGCAEDSCGAASAFVREAWIGDQTKYHECKARESERLSRCFEFGGICVFGLALVVPLLHLTLFKALSLSGGVVGPDSEEFFGAALTVCALVLPAQGAALGGIRTHREYSRLARRSEDMVAARALSGELREQDAIGRLGGDEFGAVLEGANRDEAQRVAARMRERVVDFGRGVSTALTLSVGAAEVAGEAKIEVLLAEADRQMYCAKHDRHP